MRARCECRFVFTKCGLKDRLRIRDLIRSMLYGAGGVSEAKVQSM